MIQIPKQVNIIVIRAESLHFYHPTKKKRRRTTTWRVIFLGGTERYATPKVNSPDGCPQFDCEVTLCTKNYSNSLSMLIVDSRGHHVGQVILPLSQVVIRPPGVIGRPPLLPSNIKCGELEPTKKNSYPRGYLYFTCWSDVCWTAEEIENYVAPRKSIAGRFSSSLRSLASLSRSRLTLYKRKDTSTPFGSPDHDQANSSDSGRITVKGLKDKHKNRKKRSDCSVVSSALSNSGNSKAIFRVGLDEPQSYVASGVCSPKGDSPAHDCVVNILPQSGASTLPIPSNPFEEMLKEVGKEEDCCKDNCNLVDACSVQCSIGRSQTIGASTRYVVNPVVFREPVHLKHAKRGGSGGTNNNGGGFFGKLHKKSKSSINLNQITSASSSTSMYNLNTEPISTQTLGRTLGVDHVAWSNGVSRDNSMWLFSKDDHTITSKPPQPIPRSKHIGSSQEAPPFIAISTHSTSDKLQTTYQHNRNVSDCLTYRTNDLLSSPSQIFGREEYTLSSASKQELIQMNKSLQVDLEKMHQKFMDLQTQLRSKEDLLNRQSEEMQSVKDDLCQLKCSLLESGATKYLEKVEDSAATTPSSTAIPNGYVSPLKPHNGARGAMKINILKAGHKNYA